MVTIDKSQLFRRTRDDVTEYAYFIETENKRFVKVWSLSNTAEVKHSVVFDLMTRDLDAEFELPDFDINIGSDTSKPLPAWLEGWDSVEFDNIDL